MIREFLLTILLAAIFTGLSYPMYQRLLGRLRGRETLAAIATLILLLVLVIAPLLAVLAAGANEALRVTETIGPRLQQLVDQPGEFDNRLRGLPEQCEHVVHVFNVFPAGVGLVQVVVGSPRRGPARPHEDGSPRACLSFLISPRRR